VARVELRQLSKTFAPGVVAVREWDLTIEDGQFVVVVGPSGCGKTTALRMMAGLERPSGGDILFDGRSVTSTAPVDRGVAMVFQHASLYPHLTIEENLGFGLRMRGVERRRRRSRVAEMADRLRVGDKLQRFPGELSGGEQQRVALGRALIRDPKVLLLDEPLAHLDPELRLVLRQELERLWEEQPRTTIYVTHDHVEAMTMGQKCVVLRQGEIQQCGSAAELYRCPDTTFVATFLGSPGMNLWPGEVREGVFTWDGSSGQVPAPTAISGACFCGIRPESMTIDCRYEGRLTMRVVRVESLGYQELVWGMVGEATVVVRRECTGEIAVGQVVPLQFELSDLHWFDGAGRRVVELA
jgi:sn-glycerol 3-phosphate transport system ATP-binding protein